MIWGGSGERARRPCELSSTAVTRQGSQGKSCNVTLAATPCLWIRVGRTDASPRSQPDLPPVGLDFDAVGLRSRLSGPFLPPHVALFRSPCAQPTAEGQRSYCRLGVYTNCGECGTGTFFLVPHTVTRSLILSVQTHGCLLVMGYPNSTVLNIQSKQEM